MGNPVPSARYDVIALNRAAVHAARAVGGVPADAVEGASHLGESAREPTRSGSSRGNGRTHRVGSLRGNWMGASSRRGPFLHAALEVLQAGLGPTCVEESEIHDARPPTAVADEDVRLGPW